MFSVALCLLNIHKGSISSDAGFHWVKTARKPLQKMETDHRVYIQRRSVLLSYIMVHVKSLDSSTCCHEKASPLLRLKAWLFSTPWQVCMTNLSVHVHHPKTTALPLQGQWGVEGRDNCLVLAGLLEYEGFDGTLSSATAFVLTFFLLFAYKVLMTIYWST